MRRLFFQFGFLTALVVLFTGLAPARTPPLQLDAGYRQMYNLRFDQAHHTFAQWQQQHPADPMGPVSDAAAYLFSEFDRLHILESQFFVTNSAYESRSAAPPDPLVKRAFDRDIARARQMASQRLAQFPNDSHAMLAQVLAAGLTGDYLSLIERRDMDALTYIKQARTLAQQLLRLDPTCYDAYLAIGAENYLLGIKAAPVRWFLELTGAQTDKQLGLHDLRLTATKGRYLRPFARLLLAVAALRDKDRSTAKQLLAGLASEFPQNPLYRKELAKLE